MNISVVETDQQTTEKWLAWTANLPSTWSVGELKYVAAVISSNVDKKTVEGEEPVRLCNYVDVYYNDRITSDLDFMNASATIAEIEKFTLRKDDVIVTKDSESADDIAVPAHVVGDLDGVLCGYHLAIIRPQPHSLCGRFLFYCFAADIINHQFAVSAKGITRFGLSLGALGNALFPLPSLHDQHIIADFLDEKTAAIDALIAKKERLIELIEEKRQATITRAVTKGLDPDVPMKEAQSEWLDRIPDHWKEMHLKRFIDMRSGSSITSAAIEESGKYPVYGGNGLRGFTSGYTHVGERVLIGRQGAHCGNVHRVSGRFWASEHAVVVTPRQPCSISWLSELLRAMNLNQYSIAAAQPGLAVERILMLHAPVPPVEDQKRIGDEVERVRASTDHFIVRASDQIAKLREYRQTLISAAVTGQLDVRSRTARALDPTALEPLEEVLT